jgi:hypothetical protein
MKSEYLKTLVNNTMSGIEDLEGSDITLREYVSILGKVQAEISLRIETAQFRIANGEEIEIPFFLMEYDILALRSNFFSVRKITSTKKITVEFENDGKTRWSIMVEDIATKERSSLVVSDDQDLIETVLKSL